MTYRITAFEMNPGGKSTSERYVEGFDTESEAEEWGFQHLDIVLDWRVELTPPPEEKKQSQVHQFATDAEFAEAMAAAGFAWSGYPFG